MGKIRLFTNKLDVFDFCRREKIGVPNVIIERLLIMR